MKALTTTAFAIILLISQTGCAILLNTYYNRGGRKRYCKDEFKYYNINPSIDSYKGINTNGVYFFYRYVYEDQFVYSYYKFYNSGHFAVINSENRYFDLDSSYNSRNDWVSRYGYFHINSDTIITETDDGCNPNLAIGYDFYKIKQDSMKRLFTFDKMPFPYFPRWKLLSDTTFFSNDTSYYRFEHIDVDIDINVNW